MRSGVVAQKIGMTRVFTEAGEHVPVTVLQLGAVPGGRPSHQGQERLRRAPARLGRAPHQQYEQGRPRLFRQGQCRAQAQAGRIPRQRGRADPGRRRDHRRSFRRRSVRRCLRHLDRQGFCRRHEALEFRRVCAPRTACRSRTARSVRPAAVRIPARPSRTRRCPATWASSASPRSISRWCRPTSSAASFWSRARCRAPRAAGSPCATR